MSLVMKRNEWRNETQQTFDQLLHILQESLLAAINRLAQLKENWDFTALKINKYEAIESNSYGSERFGYGGT